MTHSPSSLPSSSKQPLSKKPLEPSIQQLKVLLQQGKLQQVADESQTLINQLRQDPNTTNNQTQAELLYLNAVANRLLKQTPTAQEAVAALLKLAPNHARAFQEQGYLYREQAQFSKAANAFYQATQRNPALLSSWLVLLELYRAQQQSDNTHSTHNTGQTNSAKTATVLAEQQIQYLQSLPKPILGAQDLFYDGNLASAEQVCRQFLQNNGHHPEGMLLLARIGIALNIYRDAEFLLESSTELFPEHELSRMELCQLLIKIGKFNAAKLHSSALLERKPHNPAYQAAHASALMGIGNISEALNTYADLIAKSPDKASLYLLQGHAFKANGNLSDAVNSYQQAYCAQPDFGDAYWSLANTKTYQFTNAEIQQMQEQLNKNNLSSEDRIHLHFALGKALEDRADYEQSFAHYQSGNDHKHHELAYSPEQTTAQFDLQIQHCNASLFTSLIGCGAQQADPIFIVGLPRAGSTLLEQILASHSQVDGTMELPNILSLAAKLKNQGNYPADLANIDRQYWQRFGQQYLQDTQVYRQGAPFFIDKMPNNFAHIGLIKLILPNAKIIDARRDPMACCFSGFKQLFAEGQAFSYNLDAIARYYQDYRRLMTHWDEVLPGFVLRVQHEDVINDLEGQVRRLLDFCELPFEQACIDFHQTKRQIKTPSSEQVKQPIYRSGMAQWKHFAEQLSPLAKHFDVVLEKAR